MKRWKACKVDGCEGLVDSRGWCGMHYMRWRRLGDPVATGPGRGAKSNDRRHTPDRRAVLPAKKPKPSDVSWAAGIFEGEGSMCVRCAIVYQVDPWLLYKLQEFFGGQVKDHRKWRNGYVWEISGCYGRAFLKKIWKRLSPRRQAQIRKFDWGKPPWKDSELPQE